MHKKNLPPLSPCTETYELNKNPVHRRLAIYAAYDKNGEIDAADLAYLKALKTVADNILYIADHFLQENEAEKLKHLCCYVHAQRHGEYDFGSYKRGLAYAKDTGLLEGIDELILCNDSCYCLEDSFEPIFAAMAQETCDFWGLTQNPEIECHIQSFFLVFRKPVFSSPVFHHFMQNVKTQKTVREVIKKYEVGLSRHLYSAGFTSGVYTGKREQREGMDNLTWWPLALIKMGVPLIKKKAFFNRSNNMEGLYKTRSFLIKRNPELAAVIPRKIDILAYEIKKFLYSSKINKSGKTRVKICKIPFPSVFFNER